MAKASLKTAPAPAPAPRLVWSPVNAADVRRWLKALRRLEARERDVSSRRMALEKLIDAAVGANAEATSNSVLSDSVSLMSLRRDGVDGFRLAPFRVKSQQGFREKDKSGWAATLFGILAAARRGMTYRELRQDVEKTHLGPQLQKSTKNFYRAIGRLAAKKHVVRHNGRVFTAREFRDFQRGVAAGIVKDDVAPRVVTTDSLGRVAVMRFLEGHRSGVTKSEIVAWVRGRPETNRLSKTAVYNLLSRMIRERKLVAEGDTVLLPPLPQEVVKTIENGTEPGFPRTSAARTTKST